MQIAGIEIITIEVSLLIAVLLFVRHVFAGRLHPAVMKWLWGIPALRILFPFQLPLDGLYGGMFQLEVGTGVMVLWLVGMAAIAVFFFIQNVGFKRNIRRQRTLYGKKDGLLVYFVDRHIGSCLAGLICPQIYINKTAGESPDWCRWIVKHELCHYKSMDHWYAILRLLCIVFQWFNPLVWYAAACSVEDLEIACDDRVIQDEEYEAQMDYGKCLIAMAARNPQKLLQSITTGNALGKGSIRRRIERLGETAQAGRAADTFVFLGMLILLGGCLTVPNERENSLLEMLAHAPYMESYILHYELEKPSGENVQQMTETMQYRCRTAGIEDIRVIAANDHSLFVLLPPSKASHKTNQSTFQREWEKEIAYVVYGEEFYLHTQHGRVVLDVNQDMFSIEFDAGKYSLWLNLEQAVKRNQGNLFDAGRIWGEGCALYLGQDCICTIAEENVRGYEILLMEDASFENIYDCMERLCKKNPCGVHRKYSKENAYEKGKTKC